MDLTRFQSRECIPSNNTTKKTLDSETRSSEIWLLYSPTISKNLNSLTISNLMQPPFFWGGGDVYFLSL